MFAQRSRQRWRLPVGLVVIVIGIIILGYANYKQQWVNVAVLSGPISRGQAWLVERKQHLQTGLVKNVEKVKQLAAKQNDTEQPIHFEFYTALPSMKMETVDNAVKDKPGTEKLAVTDTKNIKSGAEKQRDAFRLTSKKIFMNADELERDLSKEMVHNNDGEKAE